MDSRQGRLFAADDPPRSPWEDDELRDRLVAEVAFAEPPFGPYDYAVPDALRDRIEVGRRARVPIGKGERTMVGYVTALASAGDRPQLDWRKPLKEVGGVVDARPLIDLKLMRLARWISEHYLCELGVVLETVIPAAVRSQAGTREKTFLSIPDSLWAERETWSLQPRQRAILEVLAASDRGLTPQELAELAGCSTASIATLRKKGFIVDSVERVMSGELRDRPEKLETPPSLNDAQQAAFERILKPLHGERHETIVLHGVTGSGKTEVYIRAIEEVIRRGKQAIVLVPEISLTPQTRQRFRARFPHVAVLHSNLGDPERNWHWQRIARGESQVIVGARSAVFAPAPRLGLIVLDEEHDASFKQDTQPRYQTREVALWRAEAEHVPLVLGSATPALETWQRTRSGQFTLAELPHRVSGRPLPQVDTIDLRTEFRAGRGRGSISGPLHDAIRKTLAARGQVILMLNRRGFATSIQCPACGYAARCPDCDLPLTHHKADAIAVCHYCDFQLPAPDRCPECRFEGIRLSGLGTERLEEEIRQRYPGLAVLRMDSDTMRKPGSHEEALDKFRAGEARLLIGTQMIAKGLDFPNVMLVGVINADTALHFPDFRAAERTFQLVTQVAGRTGRGAAGGYVLVQTYNPDHPAIQAAIRHDYHQFASQELPGRQAFGYPPFGTLIRLIVRGESEPVTQAYAEELGQRLEARLKQSLSPSGSTRPFNAFSPLPVVSGVQEAAGSTDRGRGDGADGDRGMGLRGSGVVGGSGDDFRILGPAPCPLAKLRARFRFHLMLQIPDTSAAAARIAIRAVLREMPEPPGVQSLVDVDPVDML